MLIDFLQQWDLYSWPVFIITILAGFVVGIINTMAGSGSVIVYSLFMALGIPADVANGTIRVGVIMQTGAASLRFFKKGKLILKKGLLLAIPIVAGAIIGSSVAVNMPEEIFEKAIGAVLLFLLIFVIFDPKRWIEEQKSRTTRKIGFLQVILFLAIGFYGGFVHIGVGIFLLSALVVQAGYDLVKANALKVFLVLLYSPVALTVFILHDQIELVIGLIAAIGNFAGGIVGSHLAIKRGAKFIRILLILIIIIFSFHLLDIWPWIFSWFK